VQEDSFFITESSQCLKTLNRSIVNITVGDQMFSGDARFCPNSFKNLPKFRFNFAQIYVNFFYPKKVCYEMQLHPCWNRVLSKSFREMRSQTSAETQLRSHSCHISSIQYTIIEKKRTVIRR